MALIDINANVIPNRRHVSVNIDVHCVIRILSQIMGRISPALLIKNMTLIYFLLKYLYNCMLVYMYSYFIC